MQVLRSEAAVLGAIARSMGAVAELRLLSGASEEALGRFEREGLPRLRERSELLQVYVSREGGALSIVAVIDTDQWQDEMAGGYAEVTGQLPVRLDAPMEIERLLLSP